MECMNRPNSKLRTTGVSRETKAEQFEQVVAGADQRPLAVDLLQSSQQELPEAPARRIWPKTGSTVSMRRV